MIETRVVMEDGTRPVGVIIGHDESRVSEAARAWAEGRQSAQLEDCTVFGTIGPAHVVHDDTVDNYARMLANDYGIPVHLAKQLGPFVAWIEFVSAELDQHDIGPWHNTTWDTKAGKFAVWTQVNGVVLSAGVIDPTLIRDIGKMKE